jgi:hypothetical protein
MISATHVIERSPVEVLLEEIRRYLSAVDAFRREGREPRWRP